MASSTNWNVILLSILPRFANAILRGEKQMEFRKTSICKSATHVLVYSTSPEMRLLGLFEVLNVHIDSPEALWRRFGKVGKINRRDFFDYYDGYNQAVGLEVGKVWKFSRPLELRVVRKDLRPPQSFTYIPTPALERLRRWISPPLLALNS